MALRLSAAAVALSIAFPAAGAGATAAWRPASYPVGGAAPIQTSVRSANGSPVYVAKIDHTRARLALYPGLLEPPSASPRGAGEVPNGQRWRLLATFNGGFKAKAGAGGFVVNGRVDEPLLAGMGTLVEYRDGSVAILDWHGGTPAHALVLARQNLPPLVWGGRPTVRAANPSLWGATLGGGVAVWRSAVGVTAAGDLLYAAGGGQTPLSLARVLASLGADRAIELDINPEWPSFTSFRARGGRAPVKVVPNPQQSTLRFLSPDSRDFFAVYTRAGGGASVPFR